jgi:hypothetical protein
MKCRKRTSACYSHYTYTLCVLQSEINLNIVIEDVTLFHLCHSDELWSSTKYVRVFKCALELHFSLSPHNKSDAI